MSGFEEYVKFYTKDSVDDNNQPLKVVVEKIDKNAKDVRWEVAVTSSTDQQFQQVSFVNAISTTKVHSSDHFFL